MHFDSPDIQHNAERQCFECTVEGQRCVADYQLDGGVMRMTHTGVPPALAGRGIAAALVAVALAHARSNGLRVAPHCSYVRTYMQRRPDAQSLLE